MANASSLFGGGGPLPLTAYSNGSYGAGGWYATPLGGWSSSGVTLVNGVVTFTPFVPKFTATFTKLGWYHNSAAQDGQNLVLGIYESSGGRPTGDPIDETGPIATTAAAAFRSASGLSIPVVAGKLYFFAANADATLTGIRWLRDITRDYPAWPTTGLVDPGAAIAAGLSNSKLDGYTQTATYSASLPTIGTLVDNGTTSGPNMPQILIGL